jgi:hypothetical protein
VDARGRLTIAVAEDDPRLATVSMAMTVASDQSIVVKRAPWWPGPRVAPGWYEAHVALGATEPGATWAR